MTNEVKQPWKTERKKDIFEVERLQVIGHMLLRGMSKYKNLNVWYKTMGFAKEIYTICQENKFSRDFGLKSQIQRSAVSIASNIAEGSEYMTNKQSVHYFYIAKASLAETLTQLEIAQHVGYVDKNKFDRLEKKVKKLVPC